MYADAIKAFDKIHFGKLFKLLVDKRMPAIVIYLLFDNYTIQIYVQPGMVLSLIHLLH